jgi:cobalt-zinc-cadmium efflux system membrane fusion protein
MTSIKWFALSAIVLTSVLAHAGPGAHGPNGEHLDGSETPAAGGLARLADGTVNIPKLAQRRMGIQTLVGVESETARTVELPARVIVDPNASGRIQSTHGGRIEPGPKGLSVLGQKVKKGDVLGYVHHHAEPYALGNQQALLADIKAQRLTAERKAQRLVSLEGTVPRKDIEAAQAETESLISKEKSIGNSLAMREALVAPVTGVISKSELTAGQIVEPKDVLIEVVDPARVMVEATTADATISSSVKAASLQGITGITLSFMGGAKSYREGLLPMVFSVKSHNPRTPLPLAIGQPVTVVAQLPQQIKGIVLPAQALSKNATNEPIVWVKLSAERYLQQPVQYQTLNASQIVVTQGLSPNNRVVVQGAAMMSQIR